ncbi:MAG: tRNA (N(6)-L-threonylcarbamoyladenosine(37)-C(2))-methylthiotransferase MtaB, partial [Caldimicrobium sp.]
DVIVGFPGEGEKEFAETYTLIEKAPINWLHIFPFSPRPGTPAEKLEPKVHPTEIKKRVSLLKELHQKKRKTFLKINLGKVCKTIIEEENKEYYKGLTDNYIHVFIKKKEGLLLQKGKLIQTKLLKLMGDGVLAEPFKDNYIVKP